MKTKSLNMQEMTDAEVIQAERIAAGLGYFQFSYTSQSDLIGLFCWSERPGKSNGCIILTLELGFLFVSDFEDLKIREASQSKGWIGSLI